jgi:hypothetical protein
MFMFMFATLDGLMASGAAAPTLFTLLETAALSMTFVNANVASVKEMRRSNCTCPCNAAFCYI